MEEKFVSVNIVLKDLFNLLDNEFYLSIINNNEEIIFEELFDYINDNIDIKNIHDLIYENMDSIETIRINLRYFSEKVITFKLKENSALEAKIRLLLL